MKSKTVLLTILLSTLGLGVPAWCADAAPTEDALYSDGTRAINDGRWNQAETIFSGIAQQHGQRAEAALYWAAYAENKQGKQKQALETCAQLKQDYPHGKWIHECGALIIEIRGNSDSPLSPQDEQNEELKLLALNSLMQQDEARALPILQQILNGDKSENLKEHALFVLAQDPSAQAQELIARTVHNDRDPALQRKAIEMLSVTRGKGAAGTFADVYRQSSNEEVKKTILHAYLILGTPDPLLEAATHESNPELVRTAVQTLGAMGATSQLAALYRKTNNAQVKGDILNGLVASGPKGVDMLDSIARSEDDPELRRKAIRNLGVAGGNSTAPSLVAIYKKSSDTETKRAVVEALFIAGDSHDLVDLARSEKDPGRQRQIVQQLSLMHSKESSDYMLEILNK